tara:strand:+ start:4065 stop:4511 length:447 start_codon:yes stop_codon:yes gene_type:complete
MVEEGININAIREAERQQQQARADAIIERNRIMAKKRLEKEAAITINRNAKRKAKHLKNLKLSKSIKTAFSSKISQLPQETIFKYTKSGKKTKSKDKKGKKGKKGKKSKGKVGGHAGDIHFGGSDCRCMGNNPHKTTRKKRKINKKRT